MAKINKEQATHLDLILDFLNKNDDSNVDDINEKLLPDKSRDYCLSLFYILANYYPRLLYPKDNLSEDIFWATEYVPAFLHDGGFTKIYDTQFAEYEAEQKRQALADQKTQAELDIIEFQRGLGKKLLIWGFIVSVISIIASVLTTVATNHNDKQNSQVDTVALKNELQSIEQRLQKLEYKKSTDTLPKK